MFSVPIRRKAMTASTAGVAHPICTNSLFNCQQKEPKLLRDLT